MREFTIQIHSVQDVQAFVALATSRPFPVWVGNAQHRVNGKSFMEMFCLNFQLPLIVSTVCSDEEFVLLLQDAAQFVVK